MAEELLELCHNEGLNIYIFETYRSEERSNTLYKKGTGVRGGYSFHNYGLAVDFVFKDNKGNWSWSNKYNWKRFGELAKSVGFTWGGDWTRMDLAHVQLTPKGSEEAIRNVDDMMKLLNFNNKQMDEFKQYKTWLVKNAKCNNRNWEGGITKQEFAKMMFNLDKPATIKEELIEHGSSMLVNLIGCVAVTAGLYYGASMTLPVAITSAVGSVFVLQSGSKATLDSLVNKALSYLKKK